MQLTAVIAPESTEGITILRRGCKKSALQNYQENIFLRIGNSQVNGSKNPKDNLSGKMIKRISRDDKEFNSLADQTFRAEVTRINKIFNTRNRFQ